MNWTVTIGALAVLVVAALVLWKMIRKNVAKEITYEINEGTEDDIRKTKQHVKDIETNPDDPNRWL